MLCLKCKYESLEIEEFVYQTEGEQANPVSKVTRRKEGTGRNMTVSTGENILCSRPGAEEMVGSGRMGIVDGCVPRTKVSVFGYFSYVHREGERE